MAQQAEQAEGDDHVQGDHHDVGADADAEQARRVGDIDGGGDGVVVGDERAANGELGEDAGGDDAEVGDAGAASEPLLTLLGGLVSHGSPFEVADVSDGKEGRTSRSWPPGPRC